MKVNLLVECQYYENYNVGPEGFGEVPHWKPKGGHYFLMPIDSDEIMYADTADLEAAIKVVLEKENTIAEKFEYLGHEIQWSTPDKVGGLEVELEKIQKQNEKVAV